jgi:hypothetical protein
VKSFYLFAKTKDHASIIAIYEQCQSMLHKIFQRNSMAARKQQIAAAKAGVTGNGLSELLSLANQGKNHKQKKIGYL